MDDETKEQIDEFIDKNGLVVEFPDTIEHRIEAIFLYAKELDNAFDAECKECNVLRAENAELRARAERWQQTAEENSWPFEWEVATELKRQRDELRAENAELNETLKKYELHNVGMLRENMDLRARLYDQGQHPGFPQPPASGDPDEPVAGTA